jgi:hypothetical protein
MAKKTSGSGMDRDDAGNRNRTGGQPSGRTGSESGDTNRGQERSEGLERDRGTIDRDLDDETGSSDRGRGGQGGAIR